MSAEIAAVVLAAGAGRRFGGPKAFAEYAGEPLLYRPIRAARGAGITNIVVVVRSGVHDAYALAALGARVAPVSNAAADAEGQSLSLRTGVHAAGTVDALIVLLCDMPLVDALMVAALQARWRVSRPAAVVTDYGDRVAPPCLFDARTIPSLLALSGDVGARELLAALREPVVRVRRAGVRYADIDTPLDLQALRAAARLPQSATRSHAARSDSP